MFSIRVAAITCLIAVIISNVSVFAQEAISRIVGGTATTIEIVPHAIQFRSYPGEALLCGGSLVAPQYVVTAAHCFPTGVSNGARAVGGANTINDKGVQREIISITLHPEYRRPTMHSDVAVIKLDQPMTGRNIRPIALCSRPVTEGARLLVAGWGQTAEVGPLSHNIRMANMPVSSWEMCTNEYDIFVSKNMFCGSGLEAKGHCLGDSGGPAVIGNQLCGINSFGYRCGDVGHTSAFTDVYKVRPFIEEAMGL